MTEKRSIPILIVFLPFFGSVIFRLIPRVLAWPGDSPLGISWVGTFELAGLVVGGLVALIILFRRRAERA